MIKRSGTSDSSPGEIPSSERTMAAALRIVAEIEGADAFDVTTAATGVEADSDGDFLRYGESSADAVCLINRRCAQFPCTEIGNAERFLARYGSDFLSTRERGWLWFDGRRWTDIGAEEKIKQLAQATVRAIQTEADVIEGTPDDHAITAGNKTRYYSETLRAWGRKSETAKGVAAVLSLSEPLLTTPQKDLDADPWAINVQNGTLRIDRRIEGYIRLDPHDRRDLITKIANAVYDPHAAAPHWRSFFDYVLPSQDGLRREQRLLAQIAGYALTGDTSEQRFFFLWGAGRNGKGSFVRAIHHIAGGYADVVQIETFLNSGRARAGGQATPDLAKLPGVRMLSTSEPERGAALNEGLVKLFTGEDDISARHLNRDFFSFRPQAKLIIQGNYRPKIAGTDEGIWRRMTLIPWRVKIAADRVDRRLEEKFRGEASGILNWMLDGLRDWLDHGMLIPETVAEATAQYRSDSDPLGRFLQDCTRHVIGRRVSASEMHAVFCAWAKSAGETTWTPKGLSNALTERGFAKLKSSNVAWLDVELIKNVTDFAESAGDADAAGDCAYD